MPALPKPKPRARASRKLLAFLFLFFITLLVILFFQSSLSRVSVIQVEGNDLLDAESIRQAAGLKEGDRFFAIGGSDIAARVKSLKMVQDVEVTKHFPGQVHIQVKEFPKVAFQLTPEGKTEAVLADGAVVELPSGDFPLDKPILTGWSDSDPNKAALCQVLGELPASALADISEIKPDPSESYPDKIKMYTRSQYEVYTTIAYLPDKIDNLPAYIASLQENHVDGGVIRMLEVDNHAPFEMSDDPGASGSKDNAAASSGAKDAVKPAGKQGDSAQASGKTASGETPADAAGE
ncbi:FtsQ-type POTRA domain-containing protein [Paenibacillus athensensis]|uniref:Cell division protein DivIB n=2 Tax=Paenibacillus athensensis TaxID=1967502 RepID=A0A4Y8PU60_9BACL|nr:FtsQ-type POTRA domain-containing protein [Paenibacillus athensensis]